MKGQDGRKTKVYIAADHAGFALKKLLQEQMSDIEWVDLGPESEDRVDYPDFAEKVAQKVAAENGLGVLVCGSGIGMSIAANKIAGVRAAVVENPVAARLAREHNAANVLCLGSRFVAAEYGAEIVRAWLQAKPSTDERHRKRVEKIKKLES